MYLRELNEKLRKTGLLMALDVIGENLLIKYPDGISEMVTMIIGIELEAALTLNLILSAPHAMHPAGGRKSISHLQHTSSWQLIFADGSRIDVAVKLL